MKKFAFALLLLSAPAYANESIPPECRILEQHKPSGDVNYQPGVDVHGKPVVPADINAAPMGLDGQQTIVIPLSIDMAKRLQGQNIQGLDMTSTLGFIEVGPGGRVSYNGQDLTSQVHVLCDQNPMDSAVPANGQTPPDAVEYAPVKKKPKGAPAPKPVTPVLKAPDARTEPKPEPKKAPELGEQIQGGEYR
jgi:hypothetical protein